MAIEDATIAIVVVTLGRVHLLKQCVERVLDRTSSATTEIVIWNNGSTDGTRPYLDSLDDPRITVIHSPTNIGLNAYAQAFRRTSAEYLIELDDDVVDAPLKWDATLLEAYRQIPNIGFLAADLEDDEHDVTSLLRHRGRPEAYTEFDVRGIRLLDGPTGGYCAMTERALYDRAGGFPEYRNKVFFQEESAYIVAIQRLGYRKAVLADLRVHHTGGAHYASVPKEKTEYWKAHWKTVRRKNAIKRFLVRVPFVPAVNRRLGWFGEEEWEPPRPTRTRPKGPPDPAE